MCLLTLLIKQHIIVNCEFQANENRGPTFELVDSPNSDPNPKANHISAKSYGQLLVNLAGIISYCTFHESLSSEVSFEFQCSQIYGL